MADLLLNLNKQIEKFKRKINFKFYFYFFLNYN